jgi:hypothetical protein
MCTRVITSPLDTVWSASTQNSTVVHPRTDAIPTQDTTFSWVDLTALGTRKRFVRFVLICQNTSADTVEYCDAAFRIDLTGSD